MQELRIIPDHDAPNPRLEYDHLGTLWITENRHFCGDKGAEYPDDSSPVCLPVFAYIHGGIALNTKGFSCPWDSGQAGWIYVTRDKLIKEYGSDTPESRERAENCLHSEVQEYSAFLNGDVYCFSVIETTTCDSCGHENEKVVDSCCGFYGPDPDKNGMAENLEKPLSEYNVTFDN